MTPDLLKDRPSDALDRPDLYVDRELSWLAFNARVLAQARDDGHPLLERVKGAHLFRVIRDTDMVVQEDEADDLLETVDRGLRQLRHGVPSMLQVEERMPR